jgi:hypothetical protein
VAKDKNGEVIFDSKNADIFDRESSWLSTTSDVINKAMEKFRSQRYDFDSTLDSLRQLITNAV